MKNLDLFGYDPVKTVNDEIDELLGHLEDALTSSHSISIESLDADQRFLETQLRLVQDKINLAMDDLDYLRKFLTKKGVVR